MLVDDNVDGVESLADLIGILGHQVRIAHDGPTGLGAVREFDPDLVLLDIGLPGMDGHEVGAAAAEVSSVRVRSLVALSGYGRDEDRTKSREACCQQHLVKPVEFRTLQTLFASIHASAARVKWNLPGFRRIIAGDRGTKREGIFPSRSPYAAFCQTSSLFNAYLHRGTPNAL